MKNKIIHSSEIHVLSHLIGEENLSIIVYDPENTLIRDEETRFEVVHCKKDLVNLASFQREGALCILNNSQELLPPVDADYIIEFNAMRTYGKKRILRWQYISNPNGTMRWLYPGEISRPWFLAFYNFNYWKAACYKLVVKTAFLLRIQKLISGGEIMIHAGNDLAIDALIKQNEIPNREYAIFSGTLGQNRKIILATAQNKRITHFYKISLNNDSAENISSEYRGLKELQPAHFTSTVLPLAERVNSQTIKLSNIKPSHPLKTTGFGERHSQFLNQLYNYSFRFRNFNQLDVFLKTEARLLRIKKHPRLQQIPFAAGLYKQLESLYKEISTENPLIPVGISHGDFTPWNCYQDRNKLYVYDWELGNREMPLLYDFFHFQIQSAVYANNEGIQQIRKKLQDLLETGYLKKLTREFNIHTSLHLQLYLLYNASYYLDIYLDQQTLHKEAYWLFKTWGALILNKLPIISKSSQRKQFVESFFVFLSDKEYVVLKNAGKPMGDLSYSSDIDMLVKKTTISPIIEMVKTDPRVQRVKSIRKSYMTTLQIFFFDNSFLSVDLLNAFERKSIQYINPGYLLKKSVRKDGIMILDPVYDYLYIFLFYQINYADVPEKYSQYFKNLPETQEQSLLKILKINTGMDFESLERTFIYQKEIRSNLLSFLGKQKPNRAIYRVYRGFQHLVNQLKEFAGNRGLILTFSGVDGAGKSTILSEFKDRLEKKYRKKVVVIRHRPSILPILSAWKYGKEAAEQKCVDSLPRKGDNKSRLSSLFRFAYYYSDYLFGQLVVYAKYILRGYIVLYDRYYFDFIVDGKRSNIIINKGFIRGLYFFVYKPELNIFLYAKPEVILKRKKELSSEDIKQLTTSYQDLFNKLGDTSQYICIENLDKGDTLNRIEQAYLQLN